MLRFSKLHAAALAMTVMTAACAETQDEEVAITPDTTAAMPAAGSETGPSAPVVSPLAAVENSGVTGEATATHTPTDVTVAVSVSGAPDAELPAHIHTGTCATGGPVAAELTKLTNGQSSTTLTLASLPANQPLFVQVHNAAGAPIACGDMQGHGPADATTTH